YKFRRQMFAQVRVNAKCNFALRASLHFRSMWGYEHIAASRLIGCHPDLKLYIHIPPLRVAFKHKRLILQYLYKYSVFNCDFID
ncbi:hypothetical protein, partial [uncultured Duncaniella sp.]